jgi:putative FmdB family regulatory protein
MPTYEYECKICGHTFDVFQSMSDAPIKDCPECGKEVRRLINGGTGIIFKGSGFYVNDRKGGGSAANKTPSKPDSKAPGSSGGESAKPSAESGHSGSSKEGTSPPVAPEKKAAG